MGMFIPPSGRTRTRSPRKRAIAVVLLVDGQYGDVPRPFGSLQTAEIGRLGIESTVGREPGDRPPIAPNVGFPGPGENQAALTQNKVAPDLRRTGAEVCSVAKTTG